MIIKDSLSIFVLFSLICFSLLDCLNCIEFGQQHLVQLKLQNTFQQEFSIVILEEKLQSLLKAENKNADQKWFLFVDTEPSSQKTWADIFVQIFVQDINNTSRPTLKKECKKIGVQLETCYLSSQNFNYKIQELLIRISSNEELSIMVESEIVFIKKLSVNSEVAIDSSVKKREKLFQIDMKDLRIDFRQLWLSLLPTNKIYSGQSLHLYATSGSYYPTPLNYDFSSFPAWQMGVLMIIKKEQIVQSSKIYILVDLPKNYLFKFGSKSIQKNEKSIELKTSQSYNDILGRVNHQRSYLISIENPEVDNYIKIQKYSGLVIVKNVTLIDVLPSFKSQTHMNYLTEFNTEQFLDSSKFRIDKGIKKFQLLLSTSSLLNVHVIGAIYTLSVYEDSKQYNLISEDQTYLGELIKDEKSYLAARVIKHKSMISQALEASISITMKQGKIFEKIFICLIDDIEKCINAAKNQSSNLFVDTAIISKPFQVPSQFDQNYVRKTLQLQFNQSLFINYTDQYQQLIIIIEVTGQKEFQSNIFSILFKNDAVMDTISEHETKQQIIEQGEFKIYRFTVSNDENLKALSFHISIFYGQISRVVTNIDPSSKSEDELAEMVQNQPLHFQKNYEDSVEIEKIEPLKSYYLIVFASFKSLVRIKAELKKQISHPMDQTNLTFTYAILSTTSSSNFDFQPNQLILFDLSKTGYKMVLFRGFAFLPLSMCLNFNTNLNEDLPLEPNCDSRFKVGKNFQLLIDFELIKPLIGIYNSYNQTVIAKLNLETFDRCIYRKVGSKQYFGKNLFKDFSLLKACIKYSLYKKGPLLISIKSKSPVSKGLIKYSFRIGSQYEIRLTKSQTIVIEQQIEANCKGNYDNCLAYIEVELSSLQLEENPIIQQTESFEIQLQYTDESIDLIDGMTFTYLGSVTNENPVHFKYRIFTNEEVISIILQNQRGYFKILAKMINFHQFQSYPTLQDRKRQSNSTNLQQNAIFQTNNSASFLYNILKISKNDLNKHCNQQNNLRYKPCILLISVFPLHKNSIPDAKFDLQIVQYTARLLEKKVTFNFVQKNVQNFYEIENTIENSTIIIHANVAPSSSNSTIHCLQIFSVFGVGERATISNSEYTIEKGSSDLVIPNAKKGIYSLTIQEIQHSKRYCEYSIQFSVLPPSFNTTNFVVPIQILKRSDPFTINMSTQAENKIRFFFFFNNAQKANFKVLTFFQNLGELMISVMPLPQNQLEHQIQSNSGSIQEWFKPTWKNLNSLQIKSEDEHYCGDCMYLIRIQCTKEMSGSLIIPEDGEQMSVKASSLVYDQLLSNEKSLYRIYTSSNFSFKLSLVSGQIHINITNSVKDKLIFNATYAGKQQLEKYLEIQSKLSYDFYRYSIVQITAQQDSYFVFGIVKDSLNDNQTASNLSDHKNEKQIDSKPKILTFGIPYTLYLSPIRKECVTGLLETDPTFIVSLNGPEDSISSLQKLEYELAIQDKVKNRSLWIYKEDLTIKQSLKSIIIKIIESNTTNVIIKNSSQFSICFRFPQATNIDIIQSSHINYLNPNTDILVHENMNLTFIASDHNILEINQCSDHSAISISKNFLSVHSLLSEIPQIRKSNSLIQFNAKGPLYLSVQSKGSMILRWKDVDYKKAKNLGYYLYEAGSFRVLPKANPDEKLALQIHPLKTVYSLKNVSKQKLPLPQRVIYQVYVEKEQGELFQSMNCHQKTGLKLVYKFQQAKNLSNTQVIEFYVLFFVIQSMNELKAKFPTVQYVLVSIKANLQMKNRVSNQMEQYRFFYPYQEVIIVSFIKQQLPKAQNDGQGILWKEAILTIGILAILITLLLCFKKEIQRVVRRFRLSKKFENSQNLFELRSQTVRMASGEFVYRKTQQ